MKTTAIHLLLFALFANVAIAQTTPADPSALRFSQTDESFLSSMTDTINFTPFPDGTVITNQYLSYGAQFEGYNGSSDPIIYDYIGSYGRVLRSDNWYNALRLNFVDSSNTSQYQPVDHIEFDNPINSEIDYISVDVYDSLDNLIYHYLSTSPEHVVIDFETAMGAYMTFDDSASTAYVIDNILFENNITSSVHQIISEADIVISPVPFQNEITFSIPNKKVTGVSLVITNTFGQIVFSSGSNIFENTFSKTFDLGFLSSGIYFADIIIDGKRSVRKIVKE